jgi:RNA polymerase sigma factor (sigma-70 family)
MAWAMQAPIRVNRVLGIASVSDAGRGSTANPRVEPSGREQPSPDESARIRRANDVVHDLDVQHGQELFGLARRSGLADDAAEDAVQDALLRLWLEVRSGVEIIDARAWTFRTLYRIAMDQHRFRRRTAELWDRVALRAPRVVDPDVVDRISIWAVVDRLPTRQRQVLYLRYKADMTFEQAAQVMGITASAARAHAAFAGMRLRTALGEGWAG